MHGFTTAMVEKTDWRPKWYFHDVDISAGRWIEIFLGRSVRMEGEWEEQEKQEENRKIRSHGEICPR